MQTFFLFQFQKVLCIVTFFWKNGGLEDMLHMLCLDDNILQLGKFQSVALFFSIEFMGRDLCITHFLLPKQFFLKKIEKVPLTPK